MTDDGLFVELSVDFRPKLERTKSCSSVLKQADTRPISLEDVLQVTYCQNQGRSRRTRSERNGI